MSTATVRLLRAPLVAAGFIAADDMDGLIHRFETSGEASFVEYLRRSGVIDTGQARALSMIRKGYASVPVETVLKVGRPASVPPTPPAAAPAANAAAHEPVPTTNASIVRPTTASAVRRAADRPPPIPAAAAPKAAEKPPPSSAAAPRSPAPPPVREPAAETRTFAAEASARSASVPPGAARAVSLRDFAKRNTAPSRVADSWRSGTTVSTIGESSRHSERNEPAPAAAAPGSIPRVGSHFGRYTLHERIGEGSTAVIYRSFHESLGLPVAVKVFRRTDRVRDPDLKQRFFEEARLIARLDHPNIVRVLDVDWWEDVPFIVFEYVGDMTLAELVENTAGLPLEKLVRLGRQLIDGLAAAWKHGLVHRDVKPANVLVRKDGHAKLADFGLAVMGGRNAEGRALICGSPAYMAPEQITTPERVDFRTDMYGLGCTLYQAAVGVPPFDDPSADVTLRMQLNDTAVPLVKRAPGLGAAFSQVVSRMIAKHPGDRFESWESLAGALDAALRGVGTPLPVLEGAPDIERAQTSSTWRRLIDALVK